MNKTNKFLCPRYRSQLFLWRWGYLRHKSAYFFLLVRILGSFQFFQSKLFVIVPLYIWHVVKISLITIPPNYEKVSSVFTFASLCMLTVDYMSHVCFSPKNLIFFGLLGPYDVRNVFTYLLILIFRDFSKLKKKYTCLDSLAKTMTNSQCTIIC